MKDDIVLFLLIFVIVFICYEIYMKRDYKKSLKKKSKNKDAFKYPVEVRLLRDFYKLNIDDINYKRLLHIVCLTSSMDISIIVMISGMFDKGYIQILVAFILMFPIIFLSYYLVVLFYRVRNRRMKK